MLEKVKLFSIHIFSKLRKTRLKNSSTVPQKIKKKCVNFSTFNRESGAAVITALSGCPDSYLRQIIIVISLGLRIVNPLGISVLL